MAVSVRAADHKTEVGATSLQRADPGVEEFLQALARAVQQFHTYPPASSMCQSAIETCARALVVLDNRDQLHARVAPRDLVVDDTPTGRGTIVEQELARRLHAARIADVAIERSVTPRELSRFCLDLIACSGRTSETTDLIEMLGEHGVDKIALTPAYRPQVLSVGSPGDATSALVEAERRRHEELLATPGRAKHLYPPDKGWVRLDPSSRADAISLLELALLADDPMALAAMLTRLTDDEPGEGNEADALSRSFSDVTMLFAGLEPRVARGMFAKLSRAVLDLDPNRRQALLRRTILPGLLDGRMDGSVLRDFPDVDLADSLCLLLDLETAAPEVVGTALARLDLPADRQAALTPLIDERLQGRGGAVTPADTLDAHARKLTRSHGRAASFAELSAFDLALDEDTSGRLAEIRDRIVAPETLEDRLDCLMRLMALEPNPDAVTRLLNLAAPLTWQLERDGRWEALAARLARYRSLADTLREPRPDVADVLERRLGEWCTADRAAQLCELAVMGDAEGGVAGRILRALGAGMGPALVAVAQARAKQNGDGPARAAIQLLCECASVVAPALTGAPTSNGAATDRIVARVFGFAGAGYEPPLGAHLSSKDEQTVREALRALARIGTPKAASLVAQHIEAQAPFAGAAEESLWRFPATEAQRQARTLLARREFVMRWPGVAARLIDRAAQGTTAGLEPVLLSLAPLRRRIWNPSLARLGRKAKGLLTS